MQVKNGNIEFMSYDNVNEVVDELFESLILRYHIGLETSMRGSDFILIQFNGCITNVIR